MPLRPHHPVRALLAVAALALALLGGAAAEPAPTAVLDGVVAIDAPAEDLQELARPAAVTAPRWAAVLAVAAGAVRLDADGRARGALPVAGPAFALADDLEAAARSMDAASR